MFWVSWTRTAGAAISVLFFGLVPVPPLQEIGSQSDWKAAAMQNQYLQQYFYKEYWLARREAQPQAIKDLSSREPYEKQYPTDEVPSLQRAGRSRGQRPEGRTDDAEKFVEKEIGKLVHRVDRNLAAIRDSFGAAMTAFDSLAEKGKQKQLRNSLKKVSKKSKNLHTLLRPVYATLGPQGALSGHPGEDDASLHFTSELEDLAIHVKRAEQQVQDTLAGSEVVAATEYSQNMLLTLDRVARAAQRLSRAL